MTAYDFYECRACGGSGSRFDITCAGNVNTDRQKFGCATCRGSGELSVVAGWPSNPNRHGNRIVKVEAVPNHREDTDMITKAQHDNATRIMDLLAAIFDEKVASEARRVYGHTITLADMIGRGWVTGINSLAGDLLIEAAEAIETIAKHGTWQKPGDDVPFRVSTDADGNLTAESKLTCGSNVQTITLFDDEDASRTYVGRKATASRMLISVRLMELGFRAAHFHRPADEVMRWVQNPYFTGYVFDAHHATA